MSSNGSNPRLDRIERILEDLTRKNAVSQARHDREMAEIHAIERKTREDIRKSREDTTADIRKTREDMRRWARIGVKEARNHRRRIALLEAKSAEYQRRTEQNLAEITDKLDGLIGYIDRQKRTGR